MARNITQAALASMKPGQTVRDGQVKGFGARRQADSISFFLVTRIDQKQRWITIGRYGSPWTVDQARKQARQWLVDIERGGDPTAKAAEIGDAPTFDAVADLFLDEHGPKLSAKSLDDYSRTLKLHARPALGSQAIAEITHRDINTLHLSLKKTPRAANLTVAVLSKLMNWAALQGLRSGDNPCQGIKRFRETQRERYLSTEELRRVMQALDEAEAEGSESLYAIVALRLLILTGARVSEILSLKWSYVDLERGLVFLPVSKTGQKPLFLSPSALKILQALPRLENNPHVIVGRVAGEHLNTLQRPWQRIREAAHIVDVRLHDLRHSYASFAAAKGASLPQIGALLGHKSAQTTKRYAHLAADPLHAVNDAVGEIVDSAAAAETDD